MRPPEPLSTASTQLHHNPHVAGYIEASAVVDDRDPGFIDFDCDVPCPRIVVELIRSEERCKVPFQDPP